MNLGFLSWAPLLVCWEKCHLDQYIVYRSHHVLWHRFMWEHLPFTKGAIMAMMASQLYWRLRRVPLAERSHSNPTWNWFSTSFVQIQIVHTLECDDYIVYHVCICVPFIWGMVPATCSEDFGRNCRLHSLCWLVVWFGLVCVGSLLVGWLVGCWLVFCWFCFKELKWWRLFHKAWEFDWLDTLVG